MYSKPKYTKFGYVSINEKFRYSFEENLKYGRYCKSAIAVIDATKNEMTCVEIKGVKTNKDEYKSI